MTVFRRLKMEEVMVQRAVFAVIAGSCLILAAECAQGEETRTVVGNAVGLSCYMNGTQSDAECTKSALSAGEPAGILDDTTGTFYIAVSEDNAANEAKQLLPYAAKRVEVKGSVSERDGIRTIAVRSVTEAERAAGAETSSNGVNATPAVPPGG